ncbi:ATPase, T2SS/T4P/T4SS family [Ignatzschineria sp. LJL83]
MKLEHNLLIQGLIELKWMSKEAVPLLSTKMYETELSTVGKLRAHGLTSEAIFEAAIFANKTAENPLPIVDLSLLKPITNFDFSTFATLEEMLAQYVVPVALLGNRLIVATADPSNMRFFDVLSLRVPFAIEYWIAESDAIKATLLQLDVNAPREMPAFNAQSANAVEASESLEERIVEERVSEEQLIEARETEEIAAEEAMPETFSETSAEKLTETTDEMIEEVEAEDANDRFSALQDSALDVAEFESKSEDDEEDATFTEHFEDEHLSREFSEDINEYIAHQEYDSEEFGTRENEAEKIEAEEFEAEVLDENFEETLEMPYETTSETASEHRVEAIQETKIDSLIMPENSYMDSAKMLGEVLEEVAVKANEEANDPQKEIRQELGKEIPIEGDIIEYINYVLLDGITQKASDIHFEPYELSYRIRFRIDGVLHKMYVVPEEYRQSIAARLKIMAELDIAEKRLPQDGHITICLEEEEVDARMSIIPTLWGEKVVIRLLDNSEMNFSLNRLALNAPQKEMIQAAIERPQGLVLVTGPTGSGKTVTLYACLNHLNQPSKNIATVEDPIEINLEGINQLQVHPKIGLDFAEALRAFLRQDPDVLMVGEIRDYETADITMKAAQTGHLVLSTLHTNSAIETLVRLKNMGVENYNIASTVKLIIAQRLVRELCHCKEEDIVDSGYLETLGFTPQQAASRFYRASGCSECHNGYRGRFAIFEIMPISKRMEQMMLESASSNDLRKQAEREGVKNLRQAGIDKVMEGRTSLEEVLRVTIE